MHRNKPGSILRFTLALLVSASLFGACNNGEKKTDDAAKNDTVKPAEPAPAPPTTAPVDTPKQVVDSLKQKPTAPGD